MVTAVKKYLLTLFLIYCLGSSQITEAAGVLRVSPTNPRYFTDDSGKALLLVGSHNWNNGFEQPDASETFNYTAYLNSLAGYNHNFFRLWAVESPKRIDEGVTYSTVATMPFPWPRTGSGTAADGRPRFNLNQFNQAYFDRLRQRVIAARDKGMYASIMFYEGWCLAGQELGRNRECWTWHPFNPNNNSNGINADANGDGKGYEIYTMSAPVAVRDLQKAYIKKVIDTVNDLDNVLYEIANEATSKSTSWHYEMINYVKSYEATKPKKHPVGMTSLYINNANADLFNSPADWISPNDNSLENYKTNPPVSNGQKVILIDTDHIWGVGGDKVWAWKSFLRGLNPIYMDPLDITADESARYAMGHTRIYANKINLVAMTPQNSLASTTYCLANPGQEYLVYQSGTGSFTVNLTANQYAYEWFNPVSGAIAGTGTITATSGGRSFAPPFSGDAVLYLKKVTADITSPGAPSGLVVK